MGRAALENICRVKLRQQMQSLLLKLAPEPELESLPPQMSPEPAPETNIILTPGKPASAPAPSHPGGGVTRRCEGRFRTPNADASEVPEKSGWVWGYKVCWYLAFLIWEFFIR